MRTSPRPAHRAGRETSFSCARVLIGKALSGREKKRSAISHSELRIGKFKTRSRLSISDRWGKSRFRIGNPMSISNTVFRCTVGAAFKKLARTSKYLSVTYMIIVRGFLYVRIYLVCTAAVLDLGGDLYLKHTGTMVYVYHTRRAVFQARLLDNQYGANSANTERCVLGKFSEECFNTDLSGTDTIATAVEISSTEDRPREV